MAKESSPEKKAENFQKYGIERAREVLEWLRKLGNCANPKHYAFDEEEIDRIYDTIQKEVNRTRALYKVEKPYKLD